MALPVLLGGTTAPSTELVSVVGAATATLPATEAASVTLVVTPAASIDPNELRARVVRLRQGTTDLPLSDAPVTARFEPALPAVVLETGDEALVDAATYEVLVAVEHTDERRQLLTVTLTRDAAGLYAPSSIAAQRTLGLELPSSVQTWGRLLGLAAAEDFPALTIEVGPDSRIVEVRARQSEAADQPRVEVTVPPDTLPAGPDEDVDLDYEIDGGGPGTATRTVQLRSPQLATPVDVVFTVTTRLAPAGLGLTLVLGALFGTLVRVLLPRWTRLLAARRARSDLLMQIGALLAANGDNEFREAVEKARATLLAARGSAGGVESAVTEATAAVAAQLARLDEDLERIRTEYNSWNNAARERPHLPMSLRGAAEASREALATVPGDLESRDAASAETHLKGSLAQVDQLAALARTQVDDSRSAAERCATVLGEPSAGATSFLARRITVLRTTLEAQTEAQAQDAAALESDLDAIDRASAFQPSVRAELPTVANEARTAARLVDESTTPAPTRALREAAKHLDTVAKDTNTDLGHWLGQVADALARVREQLQAVLVDSTQTPPTAKVDVSTRLATGDVVGAARTWAAGAVATTHLGQGAPVVTTTPTIDSATEAAAAAAAAAAAGSAPRLPPIAVPLGPRLSSLPRQAVLGLASAGLGFVHIALALALVLLTGYALFLPDWVGSFADILTAFTWAFAVDLTVAGLATVLSTPRPGPAA